MINITATAITDNEAIVTNAIKTLFGPLKPVGGDNVITSVAPVSSSLAAINSPSAGFEFPATVVYILLPTEFEYCTISAKLLNDISSKSDSEAIYHDVDK